MALAFFARSLKQVLLTSNCFFARLIVSLRKKSRRHAALVAKNFQVKLDIFHSFALSLHLSKAFSYYKKLLIVKKTHYGKDYRTH